MTRQARVIQGTAKEIKAALEQIPDDEVVRLMVGRPSLSLIARRLQTEAATNEMTDILHNELIASLKKINWVQSQELERVAPKLLKQPKS